MTTHLTFEVKKKPEFVFEYLTNMQRFASVHPVISKIEQINGNSFKVYETLQFGIIPFSFTYPVDVEQSNIESPIIFRATVFKITDVEMIFTLSSNGIHTIVHEQIKFKTPLPIKSLLQSVFKKQHNLLFENINKM